MMKVDMSPQAVTARLKTLGELWLLSVKLMNSNKTKAERDYKSQTNYDYWKTIVAKLKITEECNWAAHVLATKIDDDFSDSNLGQALKYIPAEEIIENTIFAYRDWSAQPYCDEILLNFEEIQIREVFESIKNVDEIMKRGINRFFEIKNG